MLHIYGHSWPVRWGDEGEEKEVLVYSNEPEVELFVNGQSAGKRKRDCRDYPAQGFHWKVVFRPGHNTVVARSRHLTDEIAFEYQTGHWGKPAAIQLPTPRAHPRGGGERPPGGGAPLENRDWRGFSSTGAGQRPPNRGTARGPTRKQAAKGGAAIGWSRRKGPGGGGGKPGGAPSAPAGSALVKTGHT